MVGECFCSGLINVLYIYTLFRIKSCFSEAAVGVTLSLYFYVLNL